jgi:uncharacterized repeat protein (TIGR03803 family)
MKPNCHKRLGIALAVLLLPLLALLLYKSQKSSKEPAEKEFSTNGLSSFAASQNQTSPTNQPPISARNNLSIVTNPTVASLASGASATNALDQDGQISASALKQIAALEAEKGKRTPTQQKIDSQLLYADMMRRGVPIADGVPTQRVDLDKDDQGRILVDIKANVTDALLQYIGTLGGKVINNFPQYQAIRASIPLTNIEVLAARSEIKFIEPAVRAMVNNVDSQGDSTHQANIARTMFGVNGSGVKVGVLSTSVDYLTSSQINGLVTVLPGQSGIPGTGEGTAMLEIVNDLAPGAQLFFATAQGGDANLASNIQQLQAAGCNIIVDDYLYTDESPFQDGIVAQAVNNATASGVLYFSAAANSGNKDDGTSGTWEGDFVDSGDINNSLLPPNSGHVHSFGGGMLFDKITTNGPAGNDLTTVLFWADPLGASTNDYDVYLLDPTGSSVVASSTNPQNGTQDPYECVPNPSSTTNPAVGDLIVIVKFSGAGRFLHLSTGRGELAISTQGSTRGHDCATNAFGVAATPAAAPQVLGYPSGPSPNPFNSTDQIEPFSSDGPRRVFFQADGTPITPGNFSSSGGAVRQKPDITAADGVTTDVLGFAPFFGTSAAAPHAAAIVALLKSYDPSLNPSQIRTILTNTALDIMSPGIDRDSGAGIVMALAALQATGIPPPATESTVFSNLYSFTNSSVGYGPQAGLVQASDGNLYGTTYSGGAHFDGTVFKSTMNGALTRLYSFTGGNDGTEPKAGLMQGSDGNLYGTTYFGGTNFSGTVFKITTNGVLTKLYSFTGGNDGSEPQAGLIQARDGNLYGTTYSGGTNFSGTVFKITTNGVLTKLYSFTGGNDGSEPQAGLIQARDGNLYGTTYSGGTNFSGTIFKITTNGVLTRLYSFTDGNDGAWPEAGLVQASDGNLYGTTTAGGAHFSGTVFKITTNGVLTPLYSFTGGNDGSEPEAGLVQGRDGSLYGTTYSGGTNFYGTVFQITTNGVFTSLYSFTGGNDGAWPKAGLVQASNGNFYGTTTSGGSAGLGTVFQLSLIGPPVFHSMTHTGNILRLTWGVVASLAYQIQSKTNLIQPQWNNLSGVITATNATLTFSNTIGPDPQRFYRAIQLQ